MLLEFPLFHGGQSKSSLISNPAEAASSAYAHAVARTWQPMRTRVYARCAPQICKLCNLPSAASCVGEGLSYLLCCGAVVEKNSPVAEYRVPYRIETLSAT